MVKTLKCCLIDSVNSNATMVSGGVNAHGRTHVFQFVVFQGLLLDLFAVAGIRSRCTTGLRATSAGRRLSPDS